MPRAPRSWPTDRYAALTDASAAKRSRHDTASRGARTGGRYSSFAHLADVEAGAKRCRDDGERTLGGREVEPTVGRCEPERPHASARDVQRDVVAIVEPGCRHRAAELGQGPRVVLAQLHEREDRLRVDGHVRLGALDAVAGEKRIVVQHDPVVDADHGAVADGVVVRLDVRVTLREIAHVDERLRRAGWDGELVQERARTAAQLRHTRAALRGAMGVPDGVRTALGNPGEKRLGSERPVNGRLGIEAESRYAAHERDLVGVRLQSDPNSFSFRGIGRHEERRRRL